ncbi:MAG: polysaccharide pyruvyl transferase family protein [Phycisphaeraceae bacterium]
MAEQRPPIKRLTIGIITFHYAINYGAMLQAYALLDTLTRAGHDAEIIDYRPKHSREYMLRALGRSRWHPVGMAKDFLKYRRFMRFMSRHLPTSKKTFYRNEELAELRDAYDLVFTGSDQVWNNKTFGYEPPYYLDFLDPERTTLASYAPSAGSTETWGDNEDDIRRLLGRFHCLSARDQSTLDLVAGCLGNPPEHVLDPTLVGRFDTITDDRRAHPDPYMLIYHVMQSEVIDRKAAEMKQKTGLYTIALGDRSVPADQTRIAVAPERWLGYIKHADMVVTHSFHGTIFSILFRTPFVVVPHRSGSMRLIDLLQRAGVPERLLEPDTDLNALPDSFWDIDFEAIHKRLAPDIARSKAFIDHALQHAAQRG